VSDENDMRRAELDRIADFLVEDIMASPDDEISSESVDDNDDVARLAAEMTSLFPPRVFGENVIAFPVQPPPDELGETIIVSALHVDLRDSPQPGQAELGHTGVMPVPQMPVSQMPVSQMPVSHVAADPPMPPAFAHHTVPPLAVRPAEPPDRSETRGFFRKISVLLAAAVAPAFIAMHFYSALLGHLGLGDDDDDDDDDDSHEST
jgi:hypothetical protein